MKTKDEAKMLRIAVILFALIETVGLPHWALADECQDWKGKMQEARSKNDDKWSHLTGTKTDSGYYRPGESLFPDGEAQRFDNAFRTLHAQNPDIATCPRPDRNGQQQNRQNTQDETCQQAHQKLMSFENSNDSAMKEWGFEGAQFDVREFYDQQNCAISSSERQGLGNQVTDRLGSAQAASAVARNNSAVANLSLIRSEQRTLLAKRAENLCEMEAARPENCQEDANPNPLEKGKAQKYADNARGIKQEEQQASQGGGSSGSGGSSSSGSSKGAMSAMGQALGMVGPLLQALTAQKQMATLPQATPGPIQDCTNPQYAAGNIMCICQSDPKNPMCQKGEQFPSGIATSSNSGGPVAPSGSVDMPTSDGSPILAMQGKPKSASGSNTAQGGGGGGMMGGGRLQNINGSDADYGGGRGGAPQVIQGVSGNSGGSGGGGGFNGNTGGSGGGRGGYGNNTGGNGFSLRDYLPRSQSRSIAGMSVSSKDGVTAPLGPTLFEKITRQYQNQKKQMIQDR